ncbi:hypothetical protein JCM10213v2_004635 [Rhodosporidiobolus nylandii]
MSMHKAYRQAAEVWYRMAFSRSSATQKHEQQQQKQQRRAQEEPQGRIVFQGSPPAFSPATTVSPANTLGVPPTQLQQLPEEPKDDLESHDLVRRLAELTIRTFNLGTPNTENACGDVLVKEAKRLLDTDAPTSDRTAGIRRAATTNAALSLFPTSSTPTTTQELVARVPPKALVATAVSSYFHMIDWYINPLTREQYQQHEDVVFAAVASSGSTPAPAFSLAICFAVWALGLFASQPEPAYASYSRMDLAIALVELSRNALAIGRFLEQPSLDAVRAVILLATHYAVLAPGDDGGAGIGLLALAVQACLQLELHRDPDRIGGLSFAEAEDRRRIFFCVSVKDVEIASVMGRRFTLLHARDTDTKIPLDIHDHQLKEDIPGPTGEETVMTALVLRMKFAKLTEIITEEVFGPVTLLLSAGPRAKPVSYDRILDFDKQLQDLGKEIPDIYRLDSLNAQSDPLRLSKALIVDLAIRQEVFRLHRPYLARAYADDKFAYSRQRCIATARQVLELQQSPVLRASWACMNYKAISASVSLCIDLMYDQSNPEAEAFKKLIRDAVARLQQFTSISTICRRGVKLIQFLLDKLDAAARSHGVRSDDGPLFKRSRRSSEALHLAPVPGSSDLSSEDMRHKLPRSSSLNSGPSAASTSAARLSTCPRTGSSASSSSLFSTSSPVGFGGTDNGTGSPSLFPSFVAPRSTTATRSTTRLSTGAMRSAADEIASLDFPALLGLDGTSSPFTFEFATSSPAAEDAASSSATAARQEPTFSCRDSLPQSQATFQHPLGPGDESHDSGAWSFFVASPLPADPSPSSLTSAVPAEAHTLDFNLSLPFGGSSAPSSGEVASEQPSSSAQVEEGEGMSWEESGWADWLRKI